MSTPVTVPQLGESVVEATVGRWLVSEGQTVTRDQPLVELLTDKTDTEINAPIGGVVMRVSRREDEIVAVGETLCEIDENGEALAGDEGLVFPDGSATAGDPGGPASPAVRKLARENGIDLSEVRGSGDRGRITRDDVENAAAPEAVHVAPESSIAIPPPPARPSRVSPPAAGRPPAFRLPPYSPDPLDELVPFTRRRRIIADHMVYSKQTAPDVVTLAECDLNATAQLRSAHKDQYKKEGAALTYLGFVVAATVRALREFPDLNARVLNDAYVKLGHVNLGIAVDTPDGLVVPVIRDADELTIKGLAKAITDIAVRARDGKLTPDDLAGKTFTISNPGRQGNLVGGAIISQPNVGILRMGTIKKRVVVLEKDGADLIAVHPVMYMALTYDHRVVDGVHANGFLYRIVEILEAGDFDL